MDPRRSDHRPRTRRATLLRSLLDDHLDDLRRLAYASSERASDAEDALGDACLQFLTHFEGQVVEEGRHWMLVVIKRSAWSIARQRRRRAALLDQIFEPTAFESALDPAPGPADLAVLAGEADAFASAFEHLSLDQRLALTHLAFGHSHAEIAARLGWSRRKVRLSIGEGRKALRLRLGEGGGVS